MNKFSTLSIRNKTIALIIIMTIIPFGFMLYSLTTERSRQVHEAINESAIHAEQTSKLISQITGSTELLLNMLSRLPIVQAGDEKTVNSFLLDLVAQYPQFSSIFVVDKSGQRWATTNQMTGTVSYSDRKYFKYALSSGKFSSGEYAIGKVKKKPVFSFGLPVRDSSGAITGVAVATLELSGIKESLLKHSSEDRMSVIVMDHLGKILIHSTRALLEGAPEQDAVFRRILQGPEAATMEAEREQGASSRIMAYKKLYLPGEVSPYMYVLVESDKKLLMAEPNRKFGLNLTILLAAMLVSLFVAYRFSKRFVIDKVDESEHRFRSFVENTNDLIYTLSPAGIFTYVAPNVESLLGYLPDELIGKSFELFIHHEEIRSCRIFLQRLIETGTKQSGLECRILHKNGNWLWFISNASPVTDNTGCPAFLGIGRDITERKQVEEERRSMELQMQQAQKLESLGVLAGGIAHDFNNILMAIMGNADLALMRLNPESPAVDNLKRIEQSAARAADLAKQMLAYSGKGKFVVEHLDMSRLVEEMLHM
ncbi:MAG: PAS domain S-box protein, partial [Deltaproteobacteria bacterium]